MKKVINLLVLFLAITFFLLWILFNEFGLLVISIFSLNISSILMAINKFNERVYVLFFNITIFLFLLSRPVIDLIYKQSMYNYNEENGSFALIAIGLSIIFISIGNIIFQKLSLKNNTKHNGEKPKNIIYIRQVAWYLYCFTLIFNILMGIEKIFFIHGSSYLEYYINFESNLPTFVKGIATMMNTALVIYLATMPNKKESYKALILYILTAIPNLVVGSRGAISENLIFTFIYLVIRDKIDKDSSIEEVPEKNRWVTKRIKKSVIVMVPIIIVSFSIYNYTRFGTEKVNEFNPFVDFAYNQGVTFTVVTRAYDVRKQIPNVESKNYTFGPFIDYFTRGTPAQILFGVKGLGASNSIVRATEGNNFNAALSYYLYGNMYLKGYGTGSSYIIELFVDYGILGIILFSFFLGGLFALINKMLNKNIMLTIIFLRILMDVFIIPRGSAMSWLTFFIAPQFWLPIIICFTFANLISMKRRFYVIGESCSEK